MKRAFAAILLACLAVLQLLTGCAAPAAQPLQRYEASFLNLFDTVTTIVGYAESEEAFRAAVQPIHDELLIYHQLFDVYNDYEGVANLKTINDHAGEGPVEVDRRIIDLLLLCREMYDATGGRMNAAMGSVLLLWHEARNAGLEEPETAKLPEPELLTAAAKHRDFDDVIIDEAHGTVEIADPQLRLDVGAIAKGYAVEQVARSAPEGMLISVGGNVRATGARPTDGSPWVIGVQNPDAEAGEYLHTLYIVDSSVVSSGDYQRYYTVDGVRYHHIIDPDTLYPAAYWRAVTVICADSGIADALSTALFTLPMEEGQALLDRFGAVALWVDFHGEILYSEGFSDYIRT